MQTEFEEYLHTYNFSRPHQGRNSNGRTPYEIFKSGVKETKIGEENQVTEAA